MANAHYRLGARHAGRPPVPVPVPRRAVPPVVTAAVLRHVPAEAAAPPPPPPPRREMTPAERARFYASPLRTTEAELKEMGVVSA